LLLLLIKQAVEKELWRCLEQCVLELTLHVHPVGVGLLIVQARRHLAQNEDHDLDDLKIKIFM
jgi:hypothetical protein